MPTRKELHAVLSAEHVLKPACVRFRLVESDPETKLEKLKEQVNKVIEKLKEQVNKVIEAFVKDANAVGAQEGEGHGT